MTINGTTGNDNLLGTGSDDTFNMSQGGDDTVQGLGGDDTFAFGTAFTVADHIDGGSGTDTLKLNGDYSTQQNFTAQTLTSVEKIVVAAGNSYNLFFADANIAAGATLTLNASALGASNVVFTSFQHETDGTVSVTGGAGDDTVAGGLFKTVFNGGAGTDTFYAEGGVNTVNGGDGADVIAVLAPISAASKFDGGTGVNILVFDGDFTAGQSVGANFAINMAGIELAEGHNYKLNLQDGLVAAGGNLTISAAKLSAENAVTINGVHLSAGSLSLVGSAGGDRLTGGAGNDGMDGGGRVDVLTGGGGSDEFGFSKVADSTSSNFDHITDFNAALDHIHVTGVTVAHIDATVTVGDVNQSRFDTKLAAVIGPHNLHAHDAVLYTAGSGFLAGHTLLIVDANGVAGYQASADYVIDLTGMTGTLKVSSFN